MPYLVWTKGNSYMSTCGASEYTIKNQIEPESKDVACSW